MLRSGAAPFIVLNLSNSRALRRVSKHGRTPTPNQQNLSALARPSLPAPLREFGQSSEITSNQGSILCTRPALYLPFGRNCVGDPIKPLREYRGDGSTLGRITAECSGIVFGHSPLEA
jgi:hypothetical protein